MLKKIIGLLILMISVIIFLALREGNTFVVQRQILIESPPDKVFNLIDDFHNWALWSPWDKKDLAMQKIFRGPESGPGAIYEWQGNAAVGKGQMTITKVTPPYQLDIQLDFVKPMKAQNQVVFTLQPQGAITLVTWKMTGQNTFFTKVFHVFINMDKMVGADFENGLASLKVQAEKQAIQSLPLQ